MGAHLGTEGMAEAAAELDLLDLRERVNAEVNEDEVPQDIRAFFGHPLAATSTTNGDDTHASALALLHEYQNLPAIDKNDVRIGDKYGPLVDLVREYKREANHPANNNDYSAILTDDVDTFLNKNSHLHDFTMCDLHADSPHNADLLSATDDSPGPSQLGGQVPHHLESLVDLDDPVASLQAQLEDIKNDAIAAGEEDDDDSFIGEIRAEISCRVPLDEGRREFSDSSSPIEIDAAGHVEGLSDADLASTVITLPLDLPLSPGSPASMGSGRRIDPLAPSQDSSSFSSDDILERFEISNRPSFDNIIIKPDALDRGLTEQTLGYMGLPHMRRNSTDFHQSNRLTSVMNKTPSSHSKSGVCYSRDVDFSGVTRENADLFGASPYDFPGPPLPGAGMKLKTPPMRRPRKQRPKTEVAKQKELALQKNKATAKAKSKAPVKRRSNASAATQARRPQHLSLEGNLQPPPQFSLSGADTTRAAASLQASGATLTAPTELTQLLIQHRPPEQVRAQMMVVQHYPGVSGAVTTVTNVSPTTRPPTYAAFPAAEQKPTLHPAPSTNLVTATTAITNCVSAPAVATVPPRVPPPAAELSSPRYPRPMHPAMPGMITAVSLPPGWHPPLALPPPTLAPMHNLRPWHPPMAAPSGTLVVAQHHPSLLPPLTMPLIKQEPGTLCMTAGTPTIASAPTLPGDAVNSAPGYNTTNTTNRTTAQADTSVLLSQESKPGDAVTSGEGREVKPPPPLIPIMVTGTPAFPGVCVSLGAPLATTAAMMTPSAYAVAHTATGSAAPIQTSLQQSPAPPPPLAVQTSAVTNVVTPFPTTSACRAPPNPQQLFAAKRAGVPPPSPESRLKDFMFRSATTGGQQRVDSPESARAECSKKIIQKLTEKIRRNQLQRQVSATAGHDVAGEASSDSIFNFESSSAASSVCSTPACSSPGTPCAQLAQLAQPGGLWAPASSAAPDQAVRSAGVVLPKGCLVQGGAPGLRPRAASLGSCPQNETAGGGARQFPAGRPQAGMGPLVVISTQGHYQPGTYGELKSPDSGFNEAGYISPGDTSTQTHESGRERSRHTSESGARAVVKRRRSSSTVRQMCGGKPSPHPAIPKVDPDLSGYSYVMETPISTNQRINEDRITYLNKGQFYGLSLQYRQLARVLKCNTVRSNIIVVFRDDKSVTDEMKCWEFWHSRQHSIKQRILDIDTKNSSGIIPNSINEIAHNAVSLQWNPMEQPAKIHIAINCLSTDFSNQKGVKGFPLHVQVDTFEGNSSVPVHRAYCQIKIFCDKGAERKTRDEERRKETKSKLPTEPSAEQNNKKRRRKADDLFHPPCERSEFYTMVDVTKAPVLFHSVSNPEDLSVRMPSPLDLKHYNEKCVSMTLTNEDILSPKKRECPEVHSVEKNEKILLYVREAHECVFTALLLHSPSLHCLAGAIEEKFHISASKIRNVYKRCHKGILVKMDDNIIRHYSNESTFVISVKQESLGMQTIYDITLAEIQSQSNS